MNTKYMKGFYLILITIGFIWFRSSIGKLSSEKFVDGLGATLSKFSSNNPYSWYTQFLSQNIIPNAQIFGQIIQWSEFTASVLIIAGSFFNLFVKKESRVINVLLLLGVLSGAFLNLNFWLSAGWTSPSTDSLNFLMFVIELIAIFIILNILRERGKGETKR